MYKLIKDDPCWGIYVPLSHGPPDMQVLDNESKLKEIYNISCICILKTLINDFFRTSMTLL